MSEMKSSWSFVGLTPEARKAAEEAAEAAGMDLDTWLSQLIKYRSAIELRGGDRGEGERGSHGPDAAPGDPPARTPSPSPRTDPRGDAVSSSGAYVRPDRGARAERRGPTIEERAIELRRRSEPRGGEAATGSGQARDDRAGDDRARDDRAEKAPPERTAEPLAGRTPSFRKPAEARQGTPDATAMRPRPDMAQEESADGPGETPRDTADHAAESAAAPAPEATLRTTARTAARSENPSGEDRPVAKPEPEIVARPMPVAMPPGAAPEGAPRMIATDMLRPSLLGAINVVSEVEVDMAFERWQRTGRLESLIVRAAPDAPGSFEIVAGIDRWHAARRAKAPEVPIIERPLNDEDAIREGLAARLKRGHLSALDEADIYLRLMTDAGQSTEQVARLAGKPPAHVATMVRVLNLPRAVRELIERGELTVLHARALLDTHDPETIAREIVARRLDIYQTEQLVRMAAREAAAEGHAPPAPEAGSAPLSRRDEASPVSAGSTGHAPDAEEAETASSDADTTPPGGAPAASAPTATQTPTEILERHLTHLLGLKVTIAEHGDDGVVSLHYRSRDELSELIARLNSSIEA